MRRIRTQQIAILGRESGGGLGVGVQPPVGLEEGPDGGEDGGCGHEGGVEAGEGSVRRAEREERLGVVPDDGVVVEALDPEPAHALDDVLDEVGGDHGGHVPVQLGEQQHLPLLKEVQIVDLAPKQQQN